MTDASPIARRWGVMRAALDVRQGRLLVAVEAKVLGRGGVTAVAAAAGVSRSTIMAGLAEIAALDVPESAHAGRATQGGRTFGESRRGRAAPQSPGLHYLSQS